MSRRIVQIAAVPSTLVYEPGAGVTREPESLYALDNNGVAWMMLNPPSEKWIRLPELPSVLNPSTPSPERDA